MSASGVASGKTIIVTGGAQGIGKAITRRMLLDGFDVMFVDYDPEAAAETLDEYSELGKIQYFECDIGNVDWLEYFTDYVLGAPMELYGLVNNAAISKRCPVEELSIDEWRQVLNVNLTAPFYLAKTFGPLLRQSHGVVVNIASTRALMSEPDTEAYSASKGGLVALTHALAMSFAPEVRVNCISPGWIETGEWQKQSERTVPVHSEADRMQHASGRVGVPDDIADMVSYLISGKAGFVSGQNFVIDGGMTKKMIYVD